ncbi:polysaccharide biosynthesis tyrosine autokinase [Actinomadura sp. WMMA1423]|uniref:polysaccharide biosynthesis tyrosine autokinase n=1 Tax=Actinomadura sp. WMMA1423 TaxID=2591108 RepID=UPI0011462A62|nr:polysaccharide biosynthesis tyrosine autokinase [Actinomadura sp. WMMA1423]
MEFRDYLLLARRKWWIVLAGGVLAVALAGAVTLRMTPRYTATIKLFVSAEGTQNPMAVYQGATFSEQRAKSYADLLGSRRLALAVIGELRLRTGAERLRSQVRTEIVPDTVIIKASYTDPSPRRAQLVADALGRQLTLLVSDLERSGRGRPAPVKVTLVDPAELPRVPSSPHLLLNLLSALGAGLLLGFGFAVLREHLDRSVKSADQLNGLTGAPMLGAICHDPKAAKRPLVVHLDSHAARSEAFRQLRTSLRFVDVGTPVKRLVVTSCRPGEGKSTTVSNLAITLAQAGQRVAVVDADLRRPRLGEYLGIEGAAGLTDVLIGRTGLDTVLRRWGDLPMWVLPSGPVPPNPSEILGSARMRTVLEELGEHADIILFDAPPLLPVTDAVVLSRLCDGALLVARHGSTLQEQLRRAVAMLRDVDVRIVGTLLNMVPGKGHESYRYGYRHYGYHEPSVDAELDALSKEAVATAAPSGAAAGEAD